MLADAASVAEGKLYVHGGAWDRIATKSLPTTHPTMTLVLVFRVEYSEALQDIPVRIEILDEDNQPLGQAIQGMINAGHAPRTVPGTPAFAPFTWTLNGMQFERAGRYRFRVLEGEREIASVPFEVFAG